MNIYLQYICIIYTEGQSPLINRTTVASPEWVGKACRLTYCQESVPITIDTTFYITETTNRCVKCTIIFICPPGVTALGKLFY